MDSKRRSTSPSPQGRFIRRGAIDENAPFTETDSASETPPPQRTRQATFFASTNLNDPFLPPRRGRSRSRSDPTTPDSRDYSDEDIAPDELPRGVFGIWGNLDGVQEKLKGIRLTPSPTLMDEEMISPKSSPVIPAFRVSLKPLSRVHADSRIRAKSASFDYIGPSQNVPKRVRVLYLTDIVRAELASGSLTAEHLDMLYEFMNITVKDDRALGLAIISDTRCDKLLEALLQNDYGYNSEKFAKIVSNAAMLKKRWLHKFGASWFEIDERRMYEMRQTRLHDMSLIAGDKEEGQKWTVDHRVPTNFMEGNLTFGTGHWWVNLCSAYRDGIVGYSTENVTPGNYGVAALPMLTGTEERLPSIYSEEEDLFPIERVKYIKQGRTTKEVYISLMSEVGRRIRVLRGHTLQSKYAPLAGVRYDGMYKIEAYGHKRLITDDGTVIYELTLELERVPGQKRIKELSSIPTPSDMDDWSLYNRVLGEDIMKNKGQIAYLDWKDAEEKKEAEREEWRRLQDIIIDGEEKRESQIAWAKPPSTSRAATYGL